MPRYHFNVFDGRPALDVEGIDLADSRSARSESIRLASALLTHEGSTLDRDDSWRMEVTDESGLILFLLNFSIYEPAGVSRPGIPRS